MEATYAASMREKYKQSLTNSIRGGGAKIPRKPAQGVHPAFNRR